VKKITLIVEGCSDRDFFNDYFKHHKEYGKYRFKVLTSKSDCTKGCEILEFKRMAKKIQVVLDSGCDKVFVLVDLKTDCKGQPYSCIRSLTDDYLKGLQKQKRHLPDLGKVEVLVLDRELEAWMTSAWKQSDNRSLDYKKELKKLLSLDGNVTEQGMVKRFTAIATRDKKDIDPSNNKSLNRFITKMKELHAS